MNPYSSINLSPRPGEDAPAPGSLPRPYSASGPSDNSHDPSLSTVPSPPIIHTGHSSLTVWSRNSLLRQASSDQDGGQSLDRSPSSALPLPASDPGSCLASTPQSGLPPESSSASILNPYPAPAASTSYQLSVIIPSPDVHPCPLPCPLPSQSSEESCPDLECSICFSQFNNVFRCPKMLQCKHTFCLECLARINVKSAEPSALQCPLCRSLTPLPTLSLPKLATDSSVLSCLPAAMQQVYSIRFLRNKGKLQVKRSTEGQRPPTSLRSGNRSLDVGLPSPPAGARGSETGGEGTALFRLMGQPACRAFLMTSVVMVMVLLAGIVIFLLTYRKGPTPT